LVRDEMDNLALALDATTHGHAWQAIRKGLRGCCPNCGEGKMFRSYLKVNDACPHCGEELFHQRSDDAPPYMTIFVRREPFRGGILGSGGAGRQSAARLSHSRIKVCRNGRTCRASPTPA
jgi:hypothetical protein